MEARVSIVFCSSDSARGRFNDPASDVVLTGGVLVPLGGRAPSLVKGFSDGPDVGLDGWMLIFGFGAGSTLPEAAGVEEEDVEDGPPLSPPESCSLFGFAGADSFSMRRLRIWRPVSSGNAHDKRDSI